MGHLHFKSDIAIKKLILNKYFVFLFSLNILITINNIILKIIFVFIK